MSNKSQKVSDKKLNKMSLEELEKLLKKEKEDTKKDIEEWKNKYFRRQKIIQKYKKIIDIRDKIKKAEYIRPTILKTPRKTTFEDYYNECIKNKEIPKNTPYYLREALERVIREFNEGLEIEKSSLNGFSKKYIIWGEPNILPLEFFRIKKEIIKKFLRTNRNTKVRFILVCFIEKIEKETKETVKTYFSSNTHINLSSTDEKRLLSKIIFEILENLSSFQKNGSGWYFKEVLKLEIHTVKYAPIRGSAYFPLPDWIMRKKAIVSLRNTDDKCFIWSILRYLHPRIKNECRLGDLRKYEKSLCTKGITFPMKIKDISKFERLNPNIPPINVFSLSDTKNLIYPLKCGGKDCKKTIDLFLNEKDGKYHYSLIKNFSRLVRSQITTRTNEPIQICKRCFCHFTKKELLDKHISYCINNGKAVVNMPKNGSFIYFKNHYKKLPIPFVVYADFECFTKPISSCCPNTKDSYNYNYQQHEPSGFCFFVKSIIPGIRIKPITYTKSFEDEDVAKVFVEKLVEYTKRNLS